MSEVLGVCFDVLVFLIVYFEMKFFFGVGCNKNVFVRFNECYDIIFSYECYFCCVMSKYFNIKI